MSWLLNIVYAVCLVALSPWIAWRYVALKKNRRGWGQKLLGLVPTRNSNQPCIWIHAVSVGEVNLLTPIIAQLILTYPQLEIAISTTTETGFDLANRKFSEHTIFFCPFDFSWAIQRVLKRIRPDMLMLAELELWPNLIRTVDDAKIPVTVVNGRLSANSLRGYQRFSRLVRGTFKRLTVVAAQNETYAQRFRQLGCKHVHVTGSVKFDGAKTDRNNAHTQQLAGLAQIQPNDKIFVAGSTQLEEDLIAADVLQTLRKSNANARLILVPRHPERCQSLLKQLNQRGIQATLRSSLVSAEDDVHDTASQTIHPILIVDVIGELGAWWACADATYVGGSLGPRGGQNMIEPAGYGLPVSFGPNTENFREIVHELIGHQAATIVYDKESLHAFVEQAFQDPTWARAIGQRAQNVVINHLGASQRTVDILSESLRNSASSRSDSSDSKTRAA